MPSWFSPVVDVCRGVDGHAYGLVLRASHYKTHSCSLWGFATAVGAADLRSARMDPERGMLSTGTHTEDLRMTAAGRVRRPEDDADDEEPQTSTPLQERFSLVERPAGGPGVLWGRQDDWSAVPDAALVQALELSGEQWVTLARVYAEHTEVAPASQPASPAPGEATDSPPWWMTNGESDSSTPWWLRDGVRSTIAVWYERAFWIYTRDPEVEALLRRLHRALDDDTLALAMLGAPSASIFDRHMTPYLVTRGGLLFADATCMPSDLRSALPPRADVIPDDDAGIDLTGGLPPMPDLDTGTSYAERPVATARSGFAALRASLAATGIEARLRDAQCAYDSIAALWTFYALRFSPGATTYAVVVEIEPTDLSLNDGVFRVEDLEAWTRGEGPIVAPLETADEYLDRVSAAQDAGYAAWAAVHPTPPPPPQPSLEEMAAQADADAAAFDPATTTLGEYELRQIRERNDGLFPAQMTVASIRLARIWSASEATATLPAVEAFRRATDLATASALGMAVVIAPEDVGFERAWTSWAHAQSFDAFRGMCRVFREWEHPHARRQVLASHFGDSGRWPRWRHGTDAAARETAIHRIARAISTASTPWVVLGHVERLDDDGVREVLDASALARGTGAVRPGPRMLLWASDLDDALVQGWEAHFPALPVVRVGDLSVAEAVRYLTEVHPVFAAGRIALGPTVFDGLFRAVIMPRERPGANWYDVEEVLVSYAQCFWSLHGVSTDLAWDGAAWEKAMRALLKHRDQTAADRARWSGDQRSDAFRPGGTNLFGLHPDTTAFERLVGYFGGDQSDDWNTTDQAGDAANLDDDEADDDDLTDDDHNLPGD